MKQKIKIKKLIVFVNLNLLILVKSKNINQYDLSLMLWVAIDYLKNNDNYEINLIFSNNAHISLSTEIIEVTLDDQNKTF